ncbi:MAG: GNAT family N-acetyltransferase [Thermoleophilia bacterium]
MTAPDGIELRPGGPHDVEPIALLIERENRPRVGDREKIARRLEALPSVVATEDGELVAFIHCRRMAPDVVELSNMVVAGHLRRRGVGRAMVAMIEERLHAEGFRAAVFVNSRLHAGTTDERVAAARAFWLDRGYTIVFATAGTAVFAKVLGDG